MDSESMSDISDEPIINDVQCSNSGQGSKGMLRAVNTPKKTPKTQKFMERMSEDIEKRKIRGSKSVASFRVFSDGKVFERLSLDASTRVVKKAELAQYKMRKIEEEVSKLQKPITTKNGEVFNRLMEDAKKRNNQPKSIAQTNNVKVRSLNEQLKAVQSLWDYKKNKEQRRSERASEKQEIEHHAWSEQVAANQKELQKFKRYYTNKIKPLTFK